MILDLYGGCYPQFLSKIFTASFRLNYQLNTLSSLALKLLSKTLLPLELTVSILSLCVGSYIN